MFKKSFWITVISLALALTSSAQVVYKNNIGISFGGGLHSNQLSLDKEGENNPRFGWIFDMNYRHMFGRHVGWGTGLGISYYKSNFCYDDLLVTSQQVHRHNNLVYESKSHLSGWTESQRTLNIEVPLALYIVAPLNEKWQFLSGLGGKLMLPVWNRYHVIDGEMEATGYFKETNIEYHDLPKHGFTKYHNFYGSSDIKAITCAGFVDLGLLYNLKDNYSLYMGAYASYTLLDLMKKSEKELYNGKEYTGIASSNLADGNRLMAAGVKMGFTFGYPKVRDSIRYDIPLMAAYPYCEPEIKADTRLTELTDEAREALRLAKIQRMREDSIRNEQEKARLAQEKIEKEKEEFEKVRYALSWLNRHLRVDVLSDRGVVEPNIDNDEQIKVLAEYIKANPNKMISVTGHSCNKGKEDYNIRMGKRRAEAVKEVLKDAGIPEKNIRLYSKGSQEPIAPNNTEANRRKNRRIVISIQ